MSLRDRVLRILKSEASSDTYGLGGALPEGFGDTYKRKYTKPKELSEWQKCQKEHKKNAKDYYSKEDKKCYKKKATDEYRKCYKKHGEDTPKYYSETYDRCLKTRKSDIRKKKLEKLIEMTPEEKIAVQNILNEDFGKTYKRQYTKPKELSEWQKCQKKHKKDARKYYDKKNKKCMDTEIMSQILKENNIEDMPDLPLRERALIQYVPENEQAVRQDILTMFRDGIDRIDEEEEPEMEDEAFLPEEMDRYSPSNEPLDYYSNYKELPLKKEALKLEYDPEKMAQAEERARIAKERALEKARGNMNKKEELNNIIAETIQIAEDPQANKEEIADKVDEVRELLNIDEDVSDAEIAQGMADYIQSYSEEPQYFQDIFGEGLVGGCAGCGGMCGGAMIGGAKLKKKITNWVKCVKKYGGIKKASPYYSKKTKRCYKVVKKDRRDYRRAKVSEEGKKILSPYMIFQKQMKGVKMTKDERAKKYQEWKAKYGY